MGITDELREYANTRISPNKGMLTAIADRIDAEHERLMQEQPFTIDMVPMTDESMAEHGWIRLPKDADGEYIQPSDIPYLTKANDGKRLAYYPSLELRQDGTWILAGWTPDRYRILKPTVEDVLREFAEKVIDSQIPTVHPTYEEAIAEYAFKLCLADNGKGQ